MRTAGAGVSAALFVSGMAAASLLFGCGPAPMEMAPTSSRQGACWFEDVTTDVGLDFVHDAGPLDGSHFMPQIIGSGAALFDMDQDGRLDVYLLQNGGPHGAPNRLYRQREDRTFEDISAGSGLDIAGYGMGVAIADANNDGLPDVYVSCYGADRFFLNQGKGKFREASAEAGIDNPLWGTSVSFVDYDRDGWLDLIVVNYLNIDPAQACTDAAGQRAYCHPATFPGTVTRLYHNRARAPSGRWLGFEDRTAAAGLASRPGPGLGVLCADLNGDRWPDLFIANDARPNHLWINQKDGTFKEEGVVHGVAYNGMGQAQGNMGVALGDVDGDELFDLFVTHLTSEHHTLWKQRRVGLFQDASAASQLLRSRWRGTGFGTVLGDFDHDGALDLALVNGRVSRAFPSRRAYWAPYAEHNQLFANDGQGKFRDRSAENAAFCGQAAVSRGLAVGDVDGDGALDLLVTQVGGPARLFRNVAPDRGHWLLIRLLDRSGRRDALGAEVRIKAGGRCWKRLALAGFSYLCSNDPRVHFGLGAIARIDVIDVIWPDGDRERFRGGTADQFMTLQQGQGRPLPAEERIP